MPVSMSSLRVDLTGDASSYKTMARDKVTADGLMIVADARRVASGDQVIAGLTRLERAQQRVTQQQRLDAAVQEEYARQYAQNASAQSRMAAAANDNARSLHSVGFEIAEHANALKVAALAAYAYSPALRALVNPAITAGVRALGPAAVSAGGAIIGALTPALAFLGRLSLPIGLAMGAWKGLNGVIDQGAALLEKYRNAGRSLFGEGVDEGVSKLTRFQDDKLSLSQQSYATALSGRLEESQRIIKEFLKAEIDLVDPALKLQHAWVLVNEMLAAGVGFLTQQTHIMASMGNAGWIQRMNAWMDQRGLMSIPEGSVEMRDGKPVDGSAAVASQSFEDSMRIARSRLSAGMGVTASKDKDANIGDTFTARFTDAINALSAEKEKAKEVTNEFDRFEKSIERQAAAVEAESKAVGASTGEHARLRTEMRLQEAALQDIAKNGGSMDSYADRIKKISDRMSDATQKAAELKLASDLGFERSQIGRDSIDANVAARLRPIYGDAYVSQMDSAAAGAIRLNEQLKITKGLTDDFANSASGNLTTALSDITMGTKSASEAFSNLGLSVIRSLEEMIIKMTITLPIARALQSVLGGAFGLGGGSSNPLDVNNGFVPSIDGGGFVASRRAGGMVGVGGGEQVWVHNAYYENAPRMRNGGYITDDGVPIVAHPGERILNRAETAAYNKGSGAYSFQTSIHVTVEGSGSDDPQAHGAAIAEQLKPVIEKVIDDRLIYHSQSRGMLNPVN